MILEQHFIFNYQWNNDDEHHCYRETNGFTICFDYDKDEYLINTIEGYGDFSEFTQIKSKKELIEMIKENYHEISEEFIKYFDDLLEKLESEK